MNRAEASAEHIDPALKGDIEAGNRYDEKDFNRLIEINVNALGLKKPKPWHE